MRQSFGFVPFTRFQQWTILLIQQTLASFDKTFNRLGDAFAESPVNFLGRFIDIDLRYSVFRGHFYRPLMIWTAYLYNEVGFVKAAGEPQLSSPSLRRLAH